MSIKPISILIIDQLKSVLQAISEDKYSEQITLLSSSTIGQHIRHVIDGFNSFLKGYNLGTINYDKRERNKEIENQNSVALDELIKIEHQIHTLDLNKRLNLEVGFDMTEYSPVNLIQTTAGRELAYNIGHAIHHMALIKIGISHCCPEVILPETFGVAYSTTNFKNQVCVQ